MIGARRPPVATEIIDSSGLAWSTAGVVMSTASAWRSHPWSWPYGAYQVTVTSDRGTTNIVLDLLLM